ncbi:hypothetical protein CEXT_141111 [Caerostris extrusa]|uniref:Uncharacterized protein n=1 Tax=Caerostris extrusa TaxID=172846 RepID=A0AAV4QLP8_CAEEX|nr:hypothetical protein CEXT_141111 [Caerostris extrusa]
MTRHFSNFFGNLLFQSSEVRYRLRGKQTPLQPLRSRNSQQSNPIEAVCCYRRSTSLLRRPFRFPMKNKTHSHMTGHFGNFFLQPAFNPRKSDIDYVVNKLLSSLCAHGIHSRVTPSKQTVVIEDQPHFCCVER